MALLSKRISGWRHKVIKPYLKGDVLDIGCGNAIVLKKYNALINHYVGIEFDQGRVNNLSASFRILPTSSKTMATPSKLP